MNAHECREFVCSHRTAREVAYYRRLLEAFEAAVTAGSAAVNLEGTMVDAAMATRARQFLALADRVGVQEEC